MLEIIVITLLMATVLNLGLKKMYLPTIIGYIMTGIIISYGLNFQYELKTEDIEHIAEFGVVFLMFTIGLEFSLSHLKQMKKEVFIYGNLQVFLTTAIVAFVCHNFLHYNIKSSIIVGTIISLASTAIVLKLFNENGETNTIYGKNTVGILIFQDLAVIPILLMINIFAPEENTSLGSLLSQTALSAIFLLGIMWLISKYLLTPLFDEAFSSQSQEIFLGFIFLILLGASYIAYYLGFSYSLGAFIAGLLIAETRYKHQVEADLIPFRELLLGLFFITVGMKLDFVSIWNNFSTIMVVLPVIMLVKFLIISVILWHQKYKHIIKTGLALLGLGEFSLVIIDLAKNKNLLDANTAQILNATVILSLVITPFIVNNLKNILDFIIYSILKKEKQISKEKMLQLEDHVILIGYGRLGSYLAKELRLINMNYLVIEGNQTKYELGLKSNESIILGNATQTNILELVNMKKARSVFISIGNSRKLLNICSAIRTLNDSVKIIVKVNNHEERLLLESEFLHDIGIIVETEETSKLMIEEAKEMLATNN